MLKAQPQVSKKSVLKSIADDIKHANSQLYGTYPDGNTWKN